MLLYISEWFPEKEEEKKGYTHIPIWFVWIVLALITIKIFIDMNYPSPDNGLIDFDNTSVLYFS